MFIKYSSSTKLGAHMYVRSKVSPCIRIWHCVSVCLKCKIQWAKDSWCLKRFGSHSPLVRLDDPIRQNTHPFSVYASLGDEVR